DQTIPRVGVIQNMGFRVGDTTYAGDFAAGVSFAGGWSRPARQRVCGRRYRCRRLKCAVTPLQGVNGALVHRTAAPRVDSAAMRQMDAIEPPLTGKSEGRAEGYVRQLHWVPRDQLSSGIAVATQVECGVILHPELKWAHTLLNLHLRVR